MGDENCQNSSINSPSKQMSKLVKELKNTNKSLQTGCVLHEMYFHF